MQKQGVFLYFLGGVLDHMNHSFDVNVAKKCGINPAIVFQHLYFWIEKNRANEKHFYDGHYWTYSSAKALTVIFPYMTDRQIEYAISKLIESGMIITGNYNQSAYDRTRWYAITKFGYSILQNCEMEKTEAKNVDSIHKNCEMEKQNFENEKTKICEPIPDIKTNIKTDVESMDAPSKKQTMGYFKNVFLSDEEIEKLKSEFPDDYLEKIERLSEHMESKGEKYNSHFATLRAWLRRDKKALPQSSENFVDFPSGFDLEAWSQKQKEGFTQEKMNL